MRSGFSLVELSIVLVILGLLTGGILAGQNLIRAAELRAVTTEFDRYIAASQTFRDKYFSVPGDFRDATRFWGRLSSATHCATNSAAAVVATTGVCDGDGNGNLTLTTAANQSGEAFQFWRQLANAGLIEGSYTGLSGAAGTRQTVIGENVARARLGPAGWHVHGFGFQSSASTFAWEGDYGNILMFGAAETTDILENGAISPEEAWNIDTKMDDGRPAYGSVRTYKPRTQCNTHITQTDANIAEYLFSNTNNECFLIFKTGF